MKYLAVLTVEDEYVPDEELSDGPEVVFESVNACLPYGIKLRPLSQEIQL